MPPKNKIVKKRKSKDAPAAIPIGTEDSGVSQPPAGKESEGEIIAVSPEEDLFITYLFEENMNRAQAYLRGHPKVTYDSARACASRMLARANVQAELKRRMNEEAMSEEEGIMRLSRIARGTLMPFLKQGPDGFLYFDLSHPDAEKNMYLVKEMETKRERRIEGAGEDAEEWEGEWVKVKLYDAYTATVDMLKIHGKFTKKIDILTGGEKIKGYIGWTPDAWEENDEEK